MAKKTTKIETDTNLETEAPVEKEDTIKSTEPVKKKKSESVSLNTEMETLVTDISNNIKTNVRQTIEVKRATTVAVFRLLSYLETSDEKVKNAIKDELSFRIKRLGLGNLNNIVKLNYLDLECLSDTNRMEFRRMMRKY